MVKLWHFIFIAAAATLLAGCATKTGPGPELEVKVKSRTPMNMVETRSASATPPKTVHPKSFAQCIGGVKALGPVRVNMTANEVARAAPWLDIDVDSSSVMSAEWATVCGERVRNYKVRFDADCKVKVIWFTGPQRLEKPLLELCRSKNALQDTTPRSFKWTCQFAETSLSAVQEKHTRNIYRLFRESQPLNPGRCLLPRYLD